MRNTALALLLALLAPLSARAQECIPPARCVGDEDLQRVLEVLREKRCLTNTTPTVTADSVTIIVDREGRVYGSGTGTKPYAVHVDWCNYRIDVQSRIEVQSALRLEPEWGFRFRPKAAFGILGRDLLDGRKFVDSVDVGLMVEPFFYHWVNLNGFVSFRSIGAGVGFDLTHNFGVALLLNTTWGSWRTNPFLSTYFAF